MRVPLPAAVPNLDPSWGAVLGHNLETQAQAGVDTVFTFGPLGWLNQPTYVPSLYWVHVLGFEVAFKLLVAVIFVLVLTRLERALDLALGCAAIAIAGGRPDGFSLLAIVATAIWIVQKPARPLSLQALGSAAWCLLALVKFTYFAACAAAFVCVYCALLRARSWRTASALAALQLALFALAWIACGQSLWNLPAYVRTSLWIAEGYGAAMGREGSGLHIALALLVIGCLVLASVSALRSTSGTRGRAMLVVLVSITCWLAFKNGFVRGLERETILFDFAAGAFFVLEPLGFDRGVGLRTSRRCVLALALVGHGLALGHGWDTPRRLVTDVLERSADNVIFLNQASAWRGEFESDLGPKRARYALPLVRAAIGSDSIDVFGYTQASAFLNGFAYQPRPVFQSYAAYTPELQDLNCRFLESDAAPPWILFRYQTMDDHAPNVEDAAALQVVLRDYRFVLRDKEYALLRRAARSPARAVQPVLLGSRRAGFGELVTLADVASQKDTSVRCISMRLDIRPSFLGRAVSALYKSPQLSLELEDASGESTTFRIAPGYVESGFLVAPYLDSQQRFESWLHGQACRRIVRVRVLVPAGSEWAYAPDFGLELVRADIFEPPFDPGYRSALLARVFRPVPSAITTSTTPELVLVREVEALTVEAPSELRFDVAPGPHTLHALFGIHRRAWSARPIDGTVFTIALRAADGTEVELERQLVDPTRVESDRAAQRVETNFTSGARGASLILRTLRTPGSESSPAPTSGAGAYWALVSIDS